MKRGRILTQRSIAARMACLLFVIHCVVIISAFGLMTLQFQNAGTVIIISLAYLITTALCTLIFFLPILLFFKGRTHRFSVIFATAGFVTGFLPTILIFGGLVLIATQDREAALLAVMAFAFFNAAIGLLSGLLTRYWLRKRLRENLHNSAELAEIYA